MLATIQRFGNRFMQIYFNEKPMQIAEKYSLAQLLMAQNLTHQGFAVMINQQFVPRSAYDATFLQEQDRITIILPNQGG